MIRVLVWNEYQHERSEEKIAAIYPNGIHSVIADFLKCDDIQVKTATLDDENYLMRSHIWYVTPFFRAWAQFSCIRDTIPAPSVN